MIKAEVISNPRKPDGGLGNLTCNVCGNSSGSYVSIFKRYILGMDAEVDFEGTDGYASEGIVCKGCLLEWVDRINKNLLDQCDKTVSVRR